MSCFAGSDTAPLLRATMLASASKLSKLPLDRLMYDRDNNVLGTDMMITLQVNGIAFGIDW